MTQLTDKKVIQIMQGEIAETKARLRHALQQVEHQNYCINAMTWKLGIRSQSEAKAVLDEYTEHMVKMLGEQPENKVSDGPPEEDDSHEENTTEKKDPIPEKGEA